jgi:hypothetical protein
VGSGRTGGSSYTLMTGFSWRLNRDDGAGMLGEYLDSGVEIETGAGFRLPGSFGRLTVGMTGAVADFVRGRGPGDG